MKIHFGSRKTGLTACGKSIKRRWWMPRVDRGTFYGMPMIKLTPRHDINCPDCLKCTSTRRKSRKEVTR